MLFVNPNFRKLDDILSWYLRRMQRTKDLPESIIFVDYVTKARNYPDVDLKIYAILLAMKFDEDFHRRIVEFERPGVLRRFLPALHEQLDYFFSGNRPGVITDVPPPGEPDPGHLASMIAAVSEKGATVVHYNKDDLADLETKTVPYLIQRLRYLFLLL